jgi:hypothetical protein
MHCGQWLADLMVNAMSRFCRIAELSGRFFCRALLRLGIIAAAGGAIGQALGQPVAGPDSNFEHCRAISDDAARLRCYEAATSNPAKAPLPHNPRPAPAPAPGPGTGLWRLVRTPNPLGGRDAVSVMKTANVTRSDIDLAGLMLRCGEGNIEVLVVLIRPLPPRAHPKVTVTVASRTTEFTASVVPPGAEVLLPQEATFLASGPWQAAPELSVEVGAVEGDDQPSPTKGVISLAGLGTALPRLQANCPSR